MRSSASSHPDRYSHRLSVIPMLACARPNDKWVFARRCARQSLGAAEADREVGDLQQSRKAKASFSPPGDRAESEPRRCSGPVDSAFRPSSEAEIADAFYLGMLAKIFATLAVSRRVSELEFSRLRSSIHAYGIGDRSDRVAHHPIECYQIARAVIPPRRSLCRPHFGQRID